MAYSIRNICSAAIAVALAAAPAAAAKVPRPDNRGLDTEHLPIVSRTDYVFDALSGPSGLATGEADRLAGWFDSLGLGYGDTVTLDTSAVWRNAAPADAVNAIVASYGMLVSHDAAPVTAGRPPSGSVRVVVSRAVARVDGCPDWSVGNTPTHAGATTSNYGCASMTNLAAMIANPQDLIEGRQSSPASDAMLSVKAIKTYRDAAATGAEPLKAESSKDAGGK